MAVFDAFYKTISETVEEIMKKILEEFSGSLIYILLGAGCCALFWTVLEIVSSR